MPGTVAELSESVEKSNDRLTRAIETLTRDFNESRLELSTQMSANNASIGLVKWIGAPLAVAAIEILGTTATMAYWAGQSAKSVMHLEESMRVSQEEAKTRDAQISRLLKALKIPETSTGVNAPKDAPPPGQRSIGELAPKSKQ